MAPGPITSWQIDAGKMGTVPDFIFSGSKITVDCDCSHEIKRRLLLGRKAMTNLDSILKSRDITLPKKVCIDKVHFFQASLVAQSVENPPAMRETWVRSLGWEDPLGGHGNPLQCSCLEKCPWTKELGGLQSMGSQRVGHD